MIHQTNFGRFIELFSKFQCNSAKIAPKSLGEKRKIAYISFHCRMSLYNSLSSVYWILIDTEKQLAFKMIVFSREKLTFSTKLHTFILSWAAMEKSKKIKVDTKEFQRKEQQKKIE